MTQLWSVTCHSVTFYPTQVNTPRLNPSRAGWYSIYLPRRDGRLSWPSWLASTPAGSQTCSICSITSTVVTTTVIVCVISQYIYIALCVEILVSRRGRLLTCSSGNAVRLWSVVNVGEIKHAAQHCGNGSALGVTMEDEMMLDAPASSASFDDALDMVIYRNDNKMSVLVVDSSSL